MHSHSANTHHLALLSARTKPRQIPCSPTLMTVSHSLPSMTSMLRVCSAFLVSLIILPEGVWMASLAGLIPPETDTPPEEFVLFDPFEPFE